MCVRVGVCTHTHAAMHVRVCLPTVLHCHCHLMPPQTALPVCTSPSLFSVSVHASSVTEILYSSLHYHFLACFPPVALLSTIFSPARSLCPACTVLSLPAVVCSCVCESSLPGRKFFSCSIFSSCNINRNNKWHVLVYIGVREMCHTSNQPPKNI